MGKDQIVDRVPGSKFSLTLKRRNDYGLRIFSERRNRRDRSANQEEQTLRQLQLSQYQTSIYDSNLGGAKSRAWFWGASGGGRAVGGIHDLYFPADNPGNQIAAGSATRLVKGERLAPSRRLANGDVSCSGSCGRKQLVVELQMWQMTKPVLIVGAGPVGMTMASELVRYGVPVRIVEKAAQRTDKSKALVLWSRTLELLDRGGGAAPFVDAGFKIAGG